MPHKKKTNPENDVIVKTLLEKYFETIRKENIPHTKEITAEADRLEEAIRELKKI